MVDDDLLMQQVQDVLSRYPLQPVDGNLTELAGQVNEHLVNVNIPPGFPAQAPEILVDGTRARFSYNQGMNIAECIGNAVRSPAPVIPSSTSVAYQPAGQPSEDQFMEEIQQVISRYPGLQPVGGDLHHLRGSLNTGTGPVFLTLTVPEDFPRHPAQIIFDRDIGFGKMIAHTSFGPTISEALDRIQQQISTPVPSPVSAPRIRNATWSGTLPKERYRQGPAQEHYGNAMRVPPEPAYSPSRPPMDTTAPSPTETAGAYKNEEESNAIYWVLGIGLVICVLVMIISQSPEMIIFILLIIAAAVAVHWMKERKKQDSSHKDRSDATQKVAESMAEKVAEMGAEKGVEILIDSLLK